MSKSKPVIIPTILPTEMDKFFCSIYMEGEGTFFGVYDKWTKNDSTNNLKYVSEIHLITRLNKIITEKYMEICRSEQNKAIKSRHDQNGA